MKLFDIGFLTVTLKDILDVSIVTFVFFKLYQTLKGSIALRLLGVVLTIFLFWKVVGLLQFRLLKTILDAFLDLGSLALVVIFAPEIRKFLFAISRNTFLDRLLRQVSTRSETDTTYREIVSALKDLRATGNGALIVILGKDSLEDIQETGDRLDAETSSRLIFTIFQKHSPLHDGAMIIVNDKIAAVRCILPISQRTDIAPELGMRHRAALGITEVSDALVIIVSEERRELSLANDGKLQRNVDYHEVDEALEAHDRRILNLINS